MAARFHPGDETRVFQAGVTGLPSAILQKLPLPGGGPVFSAPGGYLRFPRWRALHEAQAPEFGHDGIELRKRNGLGTGYASRPQQQRTVVGILHAQLIAGGLDQADFAAEYQVCLLYTSDAADE